MSVLSGVSEKKKRPGHMFIYIKTKAGIFLQQRNVFFFFNFVTVTVASSNLRKLTLIYHSLGLKFLLNIVLETLTTTESFEKVHDFPFTDDFTSNIFHLRLSQVDCLNIRQNL